MPWAACVGRLCRESPVAGPLRTYRVGRCRTLFAGTKPASSTSDAGNAAPGGVDGAMIRSLTPYDLGTASKRLGDYVDPQTWPVYGKIQMPSKHRIRMAHNVYYVN